jgi:predicted phosphodiesterase
MTHQQKKGPWSPEETAKLVSLRASGATVPVIAATLARAEDSVSNKIKTLRTPGAIDPTLPTLADTSRLTPPEFGYLPLKNVDCGDWIRYGLVSDTHLCCKEERLPELHNQYDIFEREGITTVFHAGNIIDGYISRINGGSVFETTIDGQAQYVVDNYPQRKGIKTYFITGDDHESWFAPGFNIGAYIGFVLKDQGRSDLQYIGHVEADIELKNKTGASTVIKIQHPGGGSAYARSYTGQKQVEALEGGEKPAILIQGHYHVSNYMQERNVHVIGMPGFQDQTIFARKKRLRMEVGGAILEFKVNPDDGAVTRCRVEFNRYFTRGYYKPYLKSDSKVLKGHIVINR